MLAEVSTEACGGYAGQLSDSFYRESGGGIKSDSFGVFSESSLSAPGGG